MIYLFSVTMHMEDLTLTPLEANRYTSKSFFFVFDMESFTNKICNKLPNVYWNRHS